MRLMLRKDPLTELTTEELTGVHGAAPVPWTPSCPLTMRITELLSNAAC